jgi:hypothetical protein
MVTNLTIAQIRAIINTDVNELPDVTVQSAIDRAASYISELVSRSSASSAIVTLANLNYAAYLAYETYADRIVEQVPGAFDAQGVLQPVANPLARQVVAKLQGLKETSDESIILLTYNFQQQESSSVVPMDDASDYPEQMRMSTVKSFW